MNTNIDKLMGEHSGRWPADVHAPDSPQPEQMYTATLSLSSKTNITSTHIYYMLRHLADVVGISNASSEYPSLCLYSSGIESCTRVLLHDNVTAEQLRQCWYAIKEACPSLNLKCAWVEWGDYSGCILKLKG